MGFNCGIIGLPNVGKSTIFNALTAAGAQAANYPFCTIEPNTGVVPVHDDRLNVLAQMEKSERVVPTAVEFVDIAGLVKGASEGAGLGNQFLGHIRSVDALAHVVRCFEDENVVHVDGSIGPARDVEVIETELMLADLASVEKRIERVAKAAKGGDKAAKAELDLLEAAKNCLDQGKPVRESLSKYPDLAQFDLLTVKPLLFVANVAEKDVAINPDENSSALVGELVKIANAKGCEVVVICGVIEQEISQLPEDEREPFLKDLGLEMSGLQRLSQAGYRLLDLITFFTAGKKETRAWTCHRGANAVEAAGKIHTDFAKGFIRAEVISYKDFVACGGESGARDKGLLRIEGKDYVVQDGDVMHFRFNV